jgi:peptide/nickel transport system permease protein
VIRRVVGRLVWSVGVLWAVVTLTFVITRVLPGDPARLVAGPQARGVDVARIRASLALDRPVVVQYGRFVGRLVHLASSEGDHSTCAAILPGVHVDLGRSYTFGQPVVRILEERVPRTVSLALVAVLFQSIVGAAIGIFAARRRHSVFDHASVIATLLGISAPTFLVGILLQYTLAHRLELLPLDGFGKTFADHARAIVLPALTLGICGAAYYTRLVRDEMIDVLGRDYVRTARAKGLGDAAVTYRHALRNALFPIITLIGLDLGTLIGGAIVTEQIFRWPGLGQLSATALVGRDGPVIVGAVLVTSTAIIASNLLVDVAYALLDPRLRG